MHRNVACVKKVQQVGCDVLPFNINKLTAISLVTVNKSTCYLKMFALYFYF